MLEENRGHLIALLQEAFGISVSDDTVYRALKASGFAADGKPPVEFGPDATFALDLRDDEAGAALLKKHGLEPGKFLCAVPRLRWTPYWEPVREVIYFKRLVYTRALIELAPIAFPGGQPAFPSWWEAVTERRKAAPAPAQIE